MNTSRVIFVAFTAFLLCSCHSRRAAASTPDSEDLQAFAAQVDELEQMWLQRGTVPQPQISFAAQTRTEGGVRVTVTPVLSEREAWNSWPDGTARLFNDAMGFMWRVDLSADAPVRWSPVHTSLAVNDTEQSYTALGAPDEALGFLLAGARLETRYGAPPNLSLRARNADDFRKAYLGTEARAGEQTGVVLFPAPSARIQAVAMQITVGVVVEGQGVRQYTFLFE